jgi:hypothetical protein
MAKQPYVVKNTVERISHAEKEDEKKKKTSFHIDSAQIIS